MADFENKSKRKMKRCKSANPKPDNLSSGKKLLMKRKRPKSTGRNLGILDRKYLELREIVLGSIAARLPMEKLLLAMQENKRLEQILNNKSSQLLPLNQSIQASRMYKKAFGDFQINKKEPKRSADVSKPLPPVFRSNFKNCCCGNCERKDFKLRKHEKAPPEVSDKNDTSAKKRTNKKIPSNISRSTNSLTSFANVSNNSDTNDVRRSLATRLNSSNRQESFNNGLHLVDDTYRWHNCNQEIRNWLKEKNKELRQKKLEERQLAKKEEEKAKQEKEMIEAQKLESREKVRTWLDQRRKRNKSKWVKATAKNVSAGESSAGSINNASKEIIKDENTPLMEATTEISCDEFKLVSLAIPRQNSSEKIASEHIAAENSDEEADHFKEENFRRETCSKEVISDETSNPDDKNGPENNESRITDFEKLLADFTNSDERSSKEAHEMQLNLNSDIEVSSSKNANEALIKHEIDLNRQGMVNEWLYDSGRLFGDSKVSEPFLQNTNKHIELPKSPEKIAPFLDQDVNESRKSIKIIHFDLLRDKAENGNQDDQKVDLEQFKRLIIHDDNDSESNSNNKSFNIGNNENRDISDSGRRSRSFRRTPTAMASDDEKRSEKDDEKDILKLKRGFLKFDESYRSPKKDVPTGGLFDDNPRNVDFKSSHDGRPKTSRRRIQIEKEKEIVLE